MTDEQIVHSAEAGTIEYIGADVPVLYERIDHVLEIVREIKGRTIVGVRLSARLADAVQPAAGEGGLLPCPFCGINAFHEQIYDDHRYGKWIAACYSCPAEVNEETEAAVIAAWNARAALSTSVPAGVVVISDDVARFLEGVAGVVEATRQEYSGLWQQAKGNRTWVENLSGYGATVGSLAGRPVCISLITAEIDGKKILFVHDTSVVVDHDMIRAWLEKHLPKTAWDGDRLNMTDAVNYHNVLHRAALTPPAQEPTR